MKSIKIVALVISIILAIAVVIIGGFNPIGFYYAGRALFVLGSVYLFMLAMMFVLAKTSPTEPVSNEKGKPIKVVTCGSEKDDYDEEEVAETDVDAFFNHQEYVSKMTPSVMTFDFPNGYTAKVAEIESTGYRKGLWQVSILSNGKFMLDTTVTSNELACNNPKEVKNVLRKIRKLPARKA